MKRKDHHFPLPRREQSTKVSLSEDDLISVPFLEVSRYSIPVSVFYQRTLPKKIRPEDRHQERELLVIEREPDLLEEELGFPQEVIKERVKEAEKPRRVVKSVVKQRNPKAREIKYLLPSEIKNEEGETSEVLPSYDRVSVVMAFRGRNDGRLEGLRKCIKCFREQTINCYIILVEQDHSPVHQNELDPLVDSYLFAYSRALFNKAWSFNCGAMLAPDELILFHDGDMLVPRTFVSESIKVLGKYDAAFTWSRIIYLTEESSRVYPAGPVRTRGITPGEGAVGGSFITTKKFYLGIGGMDERFEGWGHEDRVFCEKAAKLGRLKRANRQSGLTMVHHYHRESDRWHPHIQINTNLLDEYIRMSSKEIMVRVKSLGPIGDPLRYRSKEKTHE
jgi:hypothetical protein